LIFSKLRWLIRSRCIFPSYLKKGNLGFAIDEVIDPRTRRFRKISIGDYDGRNVVILERQIRTLEREVKELEGKDGRIADSARKIDEEIQRLKKRRVSLFANAFRHRLHRIDTILPLQLS
jgi:hypothetical protein